MENRSESIGKLTEALSKAQGEIKGAIKDSENPFFRMTYASLASVWDAAREPLTKNGLAVIQVTKLIDGKLILETVLTHISGEWYSSIYPLNPMKQLKNEGWTPSEDPQSMGSCFSYGRRYSLTAIVGIATADDDGNAATGKDGGKKKPEEKKGDAPTETITAIVTNVTQTEETRKDKSKFLKYSVHVGEQKFTTFSSTVAKTASTAKRDSQPVVIEFKSTTFGPEIVSLTPQGLDKTEQTQGETIQPPPDDTAQDTGYPTPEEEREVFEKAGMAEGPIDRPLMSINEFKETIKSFTNGQSLNKWFSGEKKTIPTAIMSEVSKMVNDRLIGLKKK